MHSLLFVHCIDVVDSVSDSDSDTDSYWHSLRIYQAAQNETPSGKNKLGLFI